jgi:X-X-X-Leu-X-X-Gly heptad repeat protein
MFHFQNLATRTKLSLAFGSLVLFMVILMGLAHSSLKRVQASQRDFFEKDFHLSQNLVALQINLNHVRAKGLFMLLVAGDKAKEEALQEEIRKNVVEYRALMSKLELLVAASPDYEASFGSMKSTFEKYREVRDEKVIPLARSGKLEEAKALSLGEQAERFREITDGVAVLIDSAESRGTQALQASGKLVENSFNVLWAATIAALVFAVWVIYLLNRDLAGPLNALTRQAAKIAEGDLQIETPSSTREDELGRLAAAFRAMAESLRKTAVAAEIITAGNLTRPIQPQGPRDVLGQAFAGMAESLRKVVREISDGINVLASSTSQISAGTSQLVAAASQTATAINETTTTVEEVRQTAQVASQKARAVSATAEKANQVSQAGKKAVDDTIQAMSRIRDQMESIAESTVRLGEQNLAIGEIVASVNELAEQANLLSVNAAIEAARAGEHGKGFLVVAQEVRSLADQSKAATRQVRALLNEIQKGIAKAVMAAEQGAKSVEGGVRQSEEASQAIALLTETVQEAAQAAMQIAASSHQQLVGMDQVTSAMESIRVAGNQNVSSVNQAGAAAQNINELGQRLKALVDRYKV